MSNVLADKLRQYTSLDTPKDESLTDLVVQGVAGFVPGLGQGMAARDLERARRDSDPVAGALAASSFLPWGRLIKSTKKIIAGRRALDAPHIDLDAGEAALAAGRDPTAVWQTHGMEKGLENHQPSKWEIDDTTAKLTANALKNKGRGTLGEMIDHPEFFKNYPHMRDYTVNTKFGPGNPNEGEFVYRAPREYLGKKVISSIDASAVEQEKLRQILLHEMNHAVQKYEGFDTGANYDDIAKILRSEYPQLTNFGVRNISNSRYRHNLGEQGSFATEHRAAQTAERNRQVPPSHDYLDRNAIILEDDLPGGMNYKGPKKMGLMTNKSDGTPYSIDTIEEMLDNRFSKNPFSQVSDILGSDWGMGLPDFKGDAKKYQEYARQLARSRYK